MEPRGLRCVRIMPLPEHVLPAMPDLVHDRALVGSRLTDVEPVFPSQVYTCVVIHVQILRAADLSLSSVCLEEPHNLPQARIDPSLIRHHVTGGKVVAGI